MTGEKHLRTMTVSLKSCRIRGLGMSVGVTSHKVPVVIGIDRNGPADKHGVIRVGDRILEINGIPLSKFSVAEWNIFFTNAARGGKHSVLTIEYDVSVISDVRSAGRIVIEVSYFRGNLGLTIADTSPFTIIKKIRPGSFAERCGAFQVGDTILTLGGYGTMFTGRSIFKNMAKLINEKPDSFWIEILVPHEKREVEKTVEKPVKTHEINDMGRSYSIWGQSSNSTHFPSFRVENQMVTLELSSFSEYGIGYKQAHVVQGAVICNVTPDSPAGQSGVLQIGDRIAMVNGLAFTEEIVKLEDVDTTLHLLVHFDVQVWPDVIKPLTTVSLQRQFERNFGLSVACFDHEVVVSDVMRGSIAHRCGQIDVGDIVVFINGVKVNDKEAAEQVIQSSGHTLRLELITNKSFSNDSGRGSFQSSSTHQADMIYSSRADSSEILDWGMESSCSNGGSFTSSLELDEGSSARPSVYTQSDFTFPSGLLKNCLESVATVSSSLDRISKAHLKFDFWHPVPLDSRYCPRLKNFEIRRHEYLSLGSIPVPLNSSFSSTCWIEFKDEPSERKMKVVLHRCTHSKKFGFTFTYHDGKLFVKTVELGGAASGLLKSYDEIIQVNGTLLSYLVEGHTFVNLMANIGDSVVLTVIRKESSRSVKSSRLVDEMSPDFCSDL